MLKSDFYTGGQLVAKPLILSLALVLFMTCPAALSLEKRGFFTTADNRQIALNGKQWSRLMGVKKTGVTLVYPGFVPARFSLKDVKVISDDRTHPDYSLQFRDRRNHSFTVETAFSGIGDGPDGDRVLSGSSKLFGPFTIDVFKPRSEGNGTNETYYLSNWLTLKKKQPRDAVRTYHFYGTGLSDKEAISIMKSLTQIR